MALSCWDRAVPINSDDLADVSIDALHHATARLTARPDTDNQCFILKKLHACNVWATGWGRWKRAEQFFAINKLVAF